MLKNMVKKKLILSLAFLFSLLLFCLVPKKNDFKQELMYVSENNIKTPIYLYDSNNYVARTDVLINEKNIEKKAKTLLEIMIKNGPKESKIPNGFKALISSETKINSVFFDHNVLKIDFSNEFLDNKVNEEENIIEAIIYTLTSIDKVDKVIIYINGNILVKLPKTGKYLPSALDKSFGINKKYNIETYKNVDKTTTYYVSKYNDLVYYVPITTYKNDSKEKIKVIIDELAASSIYDSNLMSYLNSNTVLLSSELEDDKLTLVFNNYILNDLTTDNILEEVIYTISLSIEANYNVKEVLFKVGDNEIYKSVIKTLDK